MRSYSVDTGNAKGINRNKQSIFPVCVDRDDDHIVPRNQFRDWCCVCKTRFFYAYDLQHALRVKTIVLSLLR